MKAVADASFLLAATLPSQFDARAADLMILPVIEWHAPRIAEQEFYHALLKFERRRSIRHADAARALLDFVSLRLAFVDDVEWLRRAYGLARAINAGLFDTIYLVAAIDLDAELWTLDQRFIRAASPRFGARLQTLT
ncbi:MAG: type II toxin-antitoxin system VapC family toxin [Dehalococcoidia bacterium]